MDRPRLQESQREGHTGPKLSHNLIHALFLQKPENQAQLRRRRSSFSASQTPSTMPAGGLRRRDLSQSKIQSALPRLVWDVG